MIIIVDFGLGNLRSIQHKLERLGVMARVSTAPQEITQADVLILPGVGHFATGMENLRRAGLVDVLTHKVREQSTPVIGICLGMQLMSKRSEEGDVDGLGWIDAVTRRFRFDSNPTPPKIPHIGWNTLRPARPHPLLAGIPATQRFYFVHSYHVCCANPADVLTTTHYGHEFVSSFQRDNIFGVQFHPEKSHREGMNIVRNFLTCARASSRSCS